MAVVSAARELLGLRGIASLDAVGLPRSLFDRLSRIVLLGALLHDLGKANQHFQALVRRTGRGQLVRHEAISVWLAWERPLRSWLSEALTHPEDLPLVLAAAAAHHRKFPSRSTNTSLGLGDRVLVYAGHPDVRKLLRFGAKVLGLGSPPALNDYTLVVPIGGDRELFKEVAEATHHRLQVDSNAHALLAVAKTLVLNADVAGSAIPENAERQGWVTTQLSQRASAADIDSVIERRLHGKQPHPFQEALSKSTSPLILLMAPCGQGKTVGAYLWFRRQHLGRQLWFCYPTTATALEGYLDYLLGVDGTDLESSRREIDLELHSTPEDSEETEALRAFDRGESLRTWGRAVTSCTVDTVLGLIQNQRKGLYAWPGLAHSAIVFDEIHSYDDRLFGVLLQFLRRLPGIPALLMTATLPTARRVALEQLCQEIHGRSLDTFTGDENLASLKRYCRTNDDPWALAEKTLAENGKVLWVSNTVDRCRDVASEAERRGLNPSVYHSRFKYADRRDRHDAIIKAFRGNGPCFATTTQVAELSLQLSADLLVTDIAPVASLIQRCGRLNRDSSPERPGGIKRVVVLGIGSPAPYRSQEIEEAQNWLQKLSTYESWSQDDLHREWHSTTASNRPTQSAWYDGGFQTSPTELRAAGWCMTMLMAEDLPAIESTPTKAAALSIPMPRPHDGAWARWPRYRYLPIAPSGTIHYDRLTGGKWRKP